MGFNKISGQAANYPILPIALPAGADFILPVGQGVVGGYGGVQAPQLATNNPLTGDYLLQLGQYTNLQMFDVGMQYWQTVQVSPYQQVTINADGVNFRVVNSTGCPVGAVITGAGSGGTDGFYGYTQFGLGQGAAVTIQNGVVTPGNTVFTITPSAGGSLWNAIVGGAINSTMTFSGGAAVYNGSYGNLFAFGSTGGAVLPNAGSNYTKPPIIVFSPPPNQGQQPYVLPTAYCTISGGAINAVTVLDQGAGLLGLPGVTIVPQPGDTTGGGAVIGWLAANNGEVNQGKVQAMWPAYYGTALTAVPTFTFGGTSNPAPSATAIMNFSVTSITNTTPGSGYTNAYALWQGGVTVGSPAAGTSLRYAQAISNPIFPPVVVTAATGVTTLSANGFGGVNIQAVPTLAFGTQLAAGTVTTVAVQTPVVGGQADVIKLQTF